MLIIKLLSLSILGGFFYVCYLMVGLRSAKLYKVGSTPTAYSNGIEANLVEALD
jgi:hypothetical protein